MPAMPERRELPPSDWVEELRRRIATRRANRRRALAAGACAVPIAALMATLLYGSGLRLMDCLRLRVKDVDLERGQIVVRGGKGDQDRVTVLPHRWSERLRDG